MDISITNLKKYVFEPKTESLRLKRANEILNQGMLVTEKVDGTKLTLVRTNEVDSNDYTKNWIVAYKGTVLYPKEFAYLTPQGKKDISQSSVGIGQYALIFDHLEKINGKIGSIPRNTEFSIEFAQNKDTLTRTYVQKGGMFLRSYGEVSYRIVGGSLNTVPKQEITEYTSVKKMADLLEISAFPIFFQGKVTKENVTKYPPIASKMTSVDWNNPLDILSKFSDAMLAIPSTLGGTTEGVVLKLDNGSFYKIVQADQYSADVRGAKKDLYKLEPEAATAYFQQIRALVQKVFDAIGTNGKTEEDIISDANFYIAKNENSLSKFFTALQQIAGNKKNLVQIKDDIHDTIRLMTSKQKLLGSNTKTIALLPIAGKPLHSGHWKLIEKAATENDNVVVYTSTSDRLRKGEFPIYGQDFVQIWSDIFIPSLPKNVKVKFVDSPLRSVMHELGWFEQTLTQDAANVPIINLYSDKEDVETNFKQEDLNKYPELLKSGKINKIGVDRASTVNVSGTKMREFLQNNDKDSFMKYLPPVSAKDKEEIWNILSSRRPKEIAEINPYTSFVAEVINQVAGEVLTEGGWRSTDTQEWEVTPDTVKEINEKIMPTFLSEFNAWSGLPALKTEGPMGSGTYYKKDLSNPENTRNEQGDLVDKNGEKIVYGDVDMLIVLPVDTNDRPTQLKANKLYAEKIREFIAQKQPKYIHANLADESFGEEYLIFNVGEQKVQSDLMRTYTVSAEWAKVRATPQQGLKGFVTGKLLSALSDALNVTLGTGVNPYVNTRDGEVVLSTVRKGSNPIFFKPNEVYLDILKFYGKKAGVENINSSSLNGHYGLDPEDASLKKKCETVVALANALDQNKIFDAGVIVSKSGDKFTSRQQFVNYVREIFIQKMEDSKVAKKLEKAQTPSAMRTIEKIKNHADLGIQMANQLIKEHYALLMESGKSIAAVDPKTPKLVNGQPAQATTKLKIVDPQGKDVHSAVSRDIKELVYVLNAKVGFWKKTNPYIENGFIFNGSSQFLMDPNKFGVLSKYKDSFGDIDVIIPKSKLDALKSFLDGIDDNNTDWNPTTQNRLSSKFHYVGRTKSYASIPDQLVTLWYYDPTKQVVQIDFEGDDMFLDPQGYEKPSEWTKFSKDSPWEDLTVGIKGLAGALMLRSLARATTVLPNAVVLTPASVKKVQSGAVTELTDKEVTKAVQHSVPSSYTLNTGGGGTGIRKAYEFVKTMPYNGKMVDAYRFVEAKETKPEDRITDVGKIFEILFGKQPSAEEKASFRSYQGLLRLMKKYLDKDKINLAIKRFTEILASEGLSPEEYSSVQKATKDILGISI